jgi:hypothetical protein
LPVGLRSVQGFDHRKDKHLLLRILHSPYLQLVDEASTARGTLQAVQFTPSGTGGILALYTMSGVNLSRTLLNEFISVGRDLAAHVTTIKWSLSNAGHCYRFGHLGLP